MIEPPDAEEPTNHLDGLKIEESEGIFLTEDSEGHQVIIIGDIAHPILRVHFCDQSLLEFLVNCMGMSLRILARHPELIIRRRDGTIDYDKKAARGIGADEPLKALREFRSCPHDPPCPERPIEEWDMFEDIAKRADYVARKMPKAIEYCLLDLILETTIVPDLKPEEAPLDRPTLDRGMREILNSRKRVIMERIGIPPKRKEPRCDLSKLSSYYESGLPLWNDAEKIHKRNFDEPNWREWIRDKHPYFEPDLIEWLSFSATSQISGNDFPMLQEDARGRLDEKLKEGYRLTTAKRIALEYAARMCGARPYDYSLTHLKNTLSSQNRTVRK